MTWEQPPQHSSPQDLYPHPLMSPDTSLQVFSSLEGAAGKVWDPLGLFARAEQMPPDLGMLAQPGFHVTGLQGG